MTEKPRQNREICYAKILFLEENIPAYVKDLSAKGLRVGIPTAVTWEPGQRKKIIIIPEEPLAIEPIKGTVEIRWTKKEELFYTCGVQFVSVKDAASRDNYGKLIAYYGQNVKPVP